MEGKPRLRTDDFFCVEPGVAGEDRLASEDEMVDFTRSRPDGFFAGDMTGGDMALCSPVLCTCVDCEDDRRKNGIEDGVSRFPDAPRRSEDDGLMGPIVGARPALGPCPLVLVRGWAISCADPA
jgi:hypothetical protein